MTLTDNQLKFLIKEVHRCHEIYENKETPYEGKGRYAVRAEASILLINLAGYNWDGKNAYRQKDNVRTYVPID